MTIRQFLKQEFKLIENIPSEIGLYSSRPIFVHDKELKDTNIHTIDRLVNNQWYRIRQYSPSFRQKDDKGYFYIVYYNKIK